MKKPTTSTSESVSEYRGFVQLRLRKQVLEAIEIVLDEESRVVHVHSSDQLIQFFRPTHIRIENLRTKTCRCLSNLRHLDRHRSFAGENSMRFIPVTTAFLLRRLRSVLVVASTQRFRHLTLQCVLKHHLRSRPNDLRQIHIPEYQSFLKLLEQSLTW